MHFFLRILFEFLDCSLGRPFCALVSCSGHVLNQVCKLFGTQVKHLPQVSIQFPNQVVTFVEFSQSHNVVSKLLRPWSRINCQLSVARHASVFVQTCLLPNMPPALTGETSRLSCLLTQPNRRIPNSIAMGTIPSFRCSTLIRICCLLRALTQFLLVIARKRLALPPCPAQAPKSQKQCALSGCFEDVAL